MGQRNTFRTRPVLCTHSGAVDTIPKAMFNPISSHLAGKTLRLFDPDCDSSNQDFSTFNSNVKHTRQLPFMEECARGIFHFHPINIFINHII